MNWQKENLFKISNKKIMKNVILSLLLVFFVLGFALTHTAQARGRYGSTRIGGYTSSGKGSHYVGGYVRSCRGWACR